MDDRVSGYQSEAIERLIRSHGSQSWLHLIKENAGNQWHNDLIGHETLEWIVGPIRAMATIGVSPVFMAARGVL